MTTKRTLKSMKLFDAVGIMSIYVLTGVSTVEATCFQTGKNK